VTSPSLQKFKRRYLRHAIQFEIFLFIVMFLSRLEQRHGAWYDPPVFALVASTVLTFLMFGVFGFGGNELFYPAMRRRALRHASLRPFLPLGFTVNAANACLEGRFNGYPVRIYWFHFNERNPKRKGLYIDIGFRGTSPPSVPAEEGLSWERGFIRSVLDAGYVRLPSFDAIHNECGRMTGVLKKHGLAPPSIGGSGAAPSAGFDMIGLN